MANDAKLEIYRALREGQFKYTYFILAATGASIGLAIHQTQDKVICITQLPLVLALVFWGLSFYFGCRYISHLHDSYYHNFMILKGEGILSDEWVRGEQRKKIEQQIDTIGNDMEKTIDSAEKDSTMQFICLICGAVSFISWHILEMYIRSI